MNECEYKLVDINNYYRKGVYTHFTKDCKCSLSISDELDVTELIKKSKETNTKFYINFLYILAKVINSRDDYKLQYNYKNDTLRVYNVMNITHYVFDEKTETCTPVYTLYNKDYNTFYKDCLSDIENAKIKGGYQLDQFNHENYFEASYISWLSYKALHIELPDGYFYYPPIINWGRYKEENGKYLMPFTVRLNHAVADGYLASKVFLLVKEEIAKFVNN